MEDNQIYTEWYCNTFNDYYGVLHRYAQRKLRGVFGDVEDCIQDVFLELWQKREQLINHPYIWGWLCVAAKYYAQNKAKKQSREVTLDPTYDVTPGTEYDSPTLDGLLAEISAVVGAESVKLFLSYYNRDVSNAVLAAQLGLTERALKVKVHRMIKFLRTRHMILLLMAIIIINRYGDRYNVK